MMTAVLEAAAAFRAAAHLGLGYRASRPPDRLRTERLVLPVTPDFLEPSAIHPPGFRPAVSSRDTAGGVNYPSMAPPQGAVEPRGPMVWGIDLGTTAAQSAVVAFWPECGALQGIAAFPERPGLDERGARDGVARLYVECHRRGELLQLGRYTVDVGRLLGAALDRFGRPARIVADRWREGDLREALDAAKVPRAILEIRGQGYFHGGEDVRHFRKACADRRVTPAPSLLLRSAMAEARTVSDPAGNSKLAKATEGGRRARARDDAAAAAILAVAAGVRMPAVPERRWRYRGAA